MLLASSFYYVDPSIPGGVLFAPDTAGITTSLALHIPGPRPGFIWEITGLTTFLRAFTTLVGGVNSPGAIDLTYFLGEEPLNTTKQDIPTFPGTPKGAILLQASSSFQVLPGQNIRATLEGNQAFLSAAGESRRYFLQEWRLTVMGDVTTYRVQRR